MALSQVLFRWQNVRVDEALAHMNLNRQTWNYSSPRVTKSSTCAHTRYQWRNWSMGYCEGWFNLLLTKERSLKSDFSALKSKNLASVLCMMLLRK